MYFYECRRVNMISKACLNLDFVHEFTCLYLFNILGDTYLHAGCRHNHTKGIVNLLDKFANILVENGSKELPFQLMNIKEKGKD